jgi:beta-glucanase (GH16 family)
VALLAASLLAACATGEPGEPPPATLAEVAVTPATLHLQVGNTAQLGLVGTDTAGVEGDLTARASWTTGDPAVAAVSASGLVTAVGAGVATVTGSATVAGVTRSGEVEVTVDAAPVGYDPGAGWDLVWSDEFDGSEVDGASWTFDVGSGGWGNSESQYYRAENATVAGGQLTITAREEPFGDAPYTSARLQTSRKRAFTYGKFSVRARLPYGQGMWPAFWMLGASSASWGLYGGDVPWPGCGEADVMEMIGGLADGSGDFTTHGTLHYLDAGGRNPAPSFARRLPERLSDAFHVHELVWTPHAFTWKIDGLAFGTKVVTPDMEEFSAPMFMLLNLAVGGPWGGWADETTVFPQTFVIDWVRVYENASTAPGGAPGLATTWHLSSTPAGGAAPPLDGAEALASAPGGLSGFQPLKVLDAPATWASPPLSGSFEEGAWSVGLFTTSPAGPSVYEVEVIVAADGGASHSLGSARVDVSTTGGGHHLSWFTIAGVPPLTLASERLVVAVTPVSGAPVTLIYNGNDFDSRLATPWSAAPP